MIRAAFRTLVALVSKPPPEPPTSRDGECLTRTEFSAIRDGACPDCGGGLRGGPEGGYAQNVACERCGAEFNVFGFGSERNSNRGQPNLQRLRAVFGIVLPGAPKDAG